jgi:hypothetical protein
MFKPGDSDSDTGQSEQETAWPTAWPNSSPTSNVHNDSVVDELILIDGVIEVDTNEVVKAKKGRFVYKKPLYKGTDFVVVKDWPCVLTQCYQMHGSSQTAIVVAI